MSCWPTIDPESLDAMAIHASMDWLDDKKDSPWMDRILKINPVYGEGYSTAGHFFVLNRRYREGITFYRKALELNPQLWEARAQLGIQLMRLGEEQEARQQLEQCYEAGYKNAETVNTLRLMDSYKNFATFETSNTILKLNKKEAELLRPYIETELRRAIATYEKKYQLKLKGPVQLEVYPDHEDFAVRTMGMPGLGALGVTFGSVVAMDSPSGRPPGTFHWASTMWHELSHVFVLQATNHRVPRWFTEGLAVYEETAASPDWGDRLDPEVITAIHSKKLLPIAELDRGFIRPSYPAQVVVSYYQAGKICNFIAEKWGYGKLLDMIHSYAKLESTPEAIHNNLAMSTPRSSTNNSSRGSRRRPKTRSTTSTNGKNN
ncbi:MAG: tetratricopeptide repeat protein [Bryobacteraceae bacterium]